MGFLRGAGSANERTGDEERAQCEEGFLRGAGNAKSKVYGSLRAATEAPGYQRARKRGMLMVQYSRIQRRGDGCDGCPGGLDS